MSDPEVPPVERRRRGRPLREKGKCRRNDCDEPELCQGLCRRCYQKEYVVRKKTEEERPDKTTKKSKKGKSSRGPWTTPDGQVLDTPYIVDIAPNSRTKCHASKERIQRDELRIGIVRSKGAPSCRWYRPEHFPAPADFSLRKLHGRKQLDHDDRSTLKKLFGHLDKESRHRSSKHHRHSSKSRGHSSSKGHHRSSSSKRSRSSKSSDSSSSKRRRTPSDESPTAPPPSSPHEYHSDSGSGSGSYSEQDNHYDQQGSFSGSSHSGSGSGSEDDGHQGQW